MTNLYAVAMGYLMPFVTLLVFLISYVLSVNFNLVKFKFRKHSSLQSFWLMTLFVYNYLAVTTFMLIHCPRVGGKLVFFYDGNVQCFKGDHLGITVLAAFVLLLLVIPLPIIVLVLTKGYWKVDPQYVSTLTNGLRPQCSWWWSVDMLRRVLLMATYTFIPHWYTKQVRPTISDNTLLHFGLDRVSLPSNISLVCRNLNGCKRCRFLCAVQHCKWGKGAGGQTNYTRCRVFDKLRCVQLLGHIDWHLCFDMVFPCK